MHGITERLTEIPVPVTWEHGSITPKSLWAGTLRARTLGNELGRCVSVLDAVPEAPVVLNSLLEVQGDAQRVQFVMDLMCPSVTSLEGVWEML